MQKIFIILILGFSGSFLSQTVDEISKMGAIYKSQVDIQTKNGALNEMQNKANEYSNEIGKNKVNENLEFSIYRKKVLKNKISRNISSREELKKEILASTDTEEKEFLKTRLKKLEIQYQELIKMQKENDEVLIDYGIK